MNLIDPDRIFTRKGDTLTFHNATDIGKARQVGETVDALSVAAPSAPFQQPNSPGGLCPVASLEDVCERAQKAAIGHKKLFSTSR